MIQGFLLTHQFQNSYSDCLQTLPRKLRIQVARRSVQLVLAERFVYSNNPVVDNVGRRNQHNQDSLVCQLDELYMLEAVFSQRWNYYYPHVFREGGKRMRRSLHQAVRSRARINLIISQELVDSL